MVFPLVNNITTSSNSLNCQVEVAKKVRIQTQVFRAPPTPLSPWPESWTHLEAKDLRTKLLPSPFV